MACLGTQVLLVTFPRPAPPAAQDSCSTSPGQRQLLDLAHGSSYAIPVLSLPRNSVLSGLVDMANEEVGEQA